jgi:GNAT superfamily N-acetyltransferase
LSGIYTNTPSRPGALGAVANPCVSRVKGETVNWTIQRAEEHQAGEVLTLQRAAYVPEAQLYDNPHLPALTETVADVCGAIARRQVLVAAAGHRIVGSVRGVVEGDLCRVIRLVVAPDMQGRGLGGALVRAAEVANPSAARFALYTGEHSSDVLRLYRKLGYVEAGTEQAAGTMALIRLEKLADDG